MKKKIVLVFSLLMCMLLSGCCLSHEWQTASCTAPKTCVKCQKTEGEPLGHTWIEATCETAKTCQICGVTEGEPLGHTPGEWEQVSLDPITLERVQVKHCAVCEETVEEEAEILTTLYEDGKFLLTCQQLFDRISRVRYRMKSDCPVSFEIANYEGSLGIVAINHEYSTGEDLHTDVMITFEDEEGTIPSDGTNAYPVLINANYVIPDSVGYWCFRVLAMSLDPSLTDESSDEVLMQMFDNDGGTGIHNGLRYKWLGRKNNNQTEVRLVVTPEE